MYYLVYKLTYTSTRSCTWSEHVCIREISKNLWDSAKTLVFCNFQGHFSILSHGANHCAALPIRISLSDLLDILEASYRGSVKEKESKVTVLSWIRITRAIISSSVCYWVMSRICHLLNASIYSQTMLHWVHTTVTSAATTQLQNLKTAPQDPSSERDPRRLSVKVGRLPSSKWWLLFTLFFSKRLTVR